ncbi:hypothetical protein [Sphingomonas sp.]|uniref:hypothetical protein n=1 Tax=Sphingomonas sp. TaxID=28214 RepID=UPI0025E91D5C|nr:hypothetical protein [Sphingomonas sp.]
MIRTTATRAKGLRQFLDDEQQGAWLDGATLTDADERPEQSFEQRFKYSGRLEKLLRRPQAEDVLDILKIYADRCIPIPRMTERFYWSVSCLPSTDKTLARVNASWMELFALQPDSSSPLVGEDVGGGPAASAAERNHLLAASANADTAPPPNPPHRGEGLGPQNGLRARIILHLSDFTRDGSPEPDQLDYDLLERLVEQPGDVSHFPWKDDTFGVRVRGAGSIRKFIAEPRGLRAIRRFNLTHMNRGRNAYQASHCYSLADVMLDD